MGGLLFRIKTWWETADKTQKLVTVMGSLFLAVLLGGTFFFASKPHMTVLYSGLSDAEQGMISTEVQKLGVPNEIDPRGNVLVPSDQVNEIRAKLAMAGKTPTNAHMGYEGLEKLNMMTTPKVEKERLKAILEGELAKTIENFDGVAAAKVMVTLGDDSPFIDEQKSATASVTITEKPGMSLTPDQGRSIAVLVANSTPGLDMKDVAVLNQRMQAIFDGRDQGGANSLIASKLNTERIEAKNRERDLQTRLDIAFGPNSTLAMVQMEIDFDDRSYNETQRTPSKLPVVSEEVKESMSGGAAGAVTGGVAGADSNLGQGQAPTATNTSESGSGYQNTQKSKTFLQDEIVTSVKESSGNVKTMSINVLANANTIKDKSQVEAFLKGYLGPKAADPNFTSTVTAVNFDQTAQKDIAKGAAAASSSAMMQQVFSLLPMLALLAVAFLVVKQIGKFSKVETMMVTRDGKMLPMGSDGAGMALQNLSPEIAAQLASSGGSSSKALHAYTQSSAPAPGGPILVNSDDSPVEIERIKGKVNVPLEQIKAMSDERPEVVAMLIKGWLLEDTVRR